MVSRETLTADHFFDLSKVWFSKIFSDHTHPWEVLTPKHKEQWIQEHITPNVSEIDRNGTLVLETIQLPVEGGTALVQAGAYLIGDNIELRAGVVVEAGAWIQGPTILGKGTAIKHGAYVRGGVITGEEAVIGHASEVKSSILLNGAKAPHFAYVGDSILGNRVNLGAGTKVSNLKMTNDEIILRIDEESVKTGLRKMGAIIGDFTETGCNSVLNPGVLLGKNCIVYPAISVRKAYYKSKSVIRK